MYTPILIFHIALGALSFAVTLLAFSSKRSAWLGRAASLFGGVLGSGIALMVMVPASFERGCVGLIVYAAVFAAAYMSVSKRLHATT
jgi:hypothetical protein